MTNSGGYLEQAMTMNGKVGYLVKFVVGASAHWPSWTTRKGSRKLCWRRKLDWSQTCCVQIFCLAQGSEDVAHLLCWVHAAYQLEMNMVHSVFVI